MEQLIELLKQIQDLAGVGIDALKDASGGGERPEGAPEGGPEGAPEGGPEGGGEAPPPAPGNGGEAPR